jgi:hypothetical protein
MSKCKALEPLLWQPKKLNSSPDFGYYHPALSDEVQKISATRVGERPIYWFFIDHDWQYFLLKYMLDRGSISFVISPEAAKAFAIPVVTRTKPAKTADVSGTNIPTEGLFTVPLGKLFGNNQTYDETDHALEVMKTPGDCDAVIPTW